MSEPERKIPDRPSIERALREAGLSARQAKRLLSGGWRLVVDPEAALVDELEDRKARLFQK